MNGPRLTLPGTIIATSRSRSGGYCGRCDGLIGAGEPIFKLDIGERGYTTDGGNGAGVWICEGCATDVQERPSPTL